MITKPLLEAYDIDKAQLKKYIKLLECAEDCEHINQVLTQAQENPITSSRVMSQLLLLGLQRRREVHFK